MNRRSGRRTFFLSTVLLALALPLSSFAEAPRAIPAAPWSADQGDGTFRNPVLFADFPDPDIIRVGSDYFFVTTTFANTPGMTILQSKDLVNWTYTGHVVPRLEGLPTYDLGDGGAYRKGVFASSLRHHNGMFYIANTPVGQNTRIYSASDIRGPWAVHELDRAAFDPGLFFDDDGTPYIATAFNGGNGDITLLTLSKDLRRVTASRVIHNVPGSEGSKIIKRNGWYYLFNAIPPRLGLTVSRSRSLTGRWETRNQIDDKTGGHQGALVDLPDGSWFGFVMVDAGAIGRMTNLSPIIWQDDWPVWGTSGAPGRVPEVAAKPIAGHPRREPATSDDFASDELGLQWQWNHNPDDRRWSLTERRGFLRLHSTVAREFWFARNTLTQKTWGPRSRGEVKLDLAGLKPGDSCGFGTLGQFSARLAVDVAPGGGRSLAMSLTEDTQKGPVTRPVATRPLQGERLWLRADLDFTTDKGTFAYSRDGADWIPFGEPFPLAFAWRTGTFQGEQFAISCFNAAPGGGFLDVDSFKLSPW